MKPDSDFGIYVHWPFCRHKCPYCDFNSHVLTQIDPERWAQAYLQAIDVWSDYRAGEVLTSVYFGGGTPSTCPPEIIDAILSKIAKHWSLEGAEITLEANPTSVESENFRRYAESGVNRVSIGFQAFNDPDLKALGRMHSVAESLQALETARRWFARTSFDIIYARQNQTVHDWEDELNQLVMLNPSHISLYQLTIEPETRFGEMYARGKLKGLPDDEFSTEMYTLTRDFMRDRGFLHYEVSNFCLPGEMSRHNLIYWNYGDYIGIGPGAHGRVTCGDRLATTQAYAPGAWLADPTGFENETLSANESAEEYILMGLRLESGLLFERLDEYGYHLPSEGLTELLELGLIEQDNRGVRATDAGRLVLNYVIGKLAT